jgi:hypothetical protein
MKRFLFLLSVVILVSSCSTLPKETNNKSILVIPIQNNQVDKSRYYVNYKLFYDTRKFFYVNPEKDYVVINNLDPGKYEIFAYEPIYKNDNHTYDKYYFHINFECSANEITILPSALEITMVKMNNLYGQSAEFKTISKEKKQQIWDMLNKDKNMSVWKIKE